MIRRGIPLLALALVACSGHRTDPAALRIGYLGNVTHAPALTARARGSFERAAAPLTVEWTAFSAGPQVVEAIYAGALDVAYLGPGPAENGFLRSRGDALRVVAGAAAGGAGLVVRKDAGIRTVADLHGKKLASPQLGNTQDVALRTFLRRNGLRTADAGGDVEVLPITNPDILTLMKRGKLDGAWVPEPWVTRLLDEAGGTLLVDEKTLWPGGRFVTTVMVATPAALAGKRAAVARVVAAHVAEVEWIRGHPREASSLVRAALEKLGGKALPQKVIDAALGNVEVTYDPMPDVLARLAADARALGYLPEGDLSKLIDRSLLDEALGRSGGR